MADEKAVQRSFSVYPRQLRFIKALAATAYRYNTSEALQALIDEGELNHSEIDLTRGDWSAKKRAREE